MSAYFFFTYSVPQPHFFPAHEYGGARPSYRALNEDDEPPLAAAVSGSDRWVWLFAFTAPRIPVDQRGVADICFNLLNASIGSDCRDWGV